MTGSSPLGAAVPHSRLAVVAAVATTTTTIIQGSPAAAAAGRRQLHQLTSPLRGAPQRGHAWRRPARQTGPHSGCAVVRGRMTAAPAVRRCLQSARDSGLAQTLNKKISLPRVVGKNEELLFAAMVPLLVRLQYLPELPCQF